MFCSSIHPIKKHSYPTSPNRNVHHYFNKTLNTISLNISPIRSIITSTSTCANLYWREQFKNKTTHLKYKVVVMLNSISIWKVPQSTFKLTKIKIDEIYIHKKVDNELHIACIYNIPSYRCGIFGYLLNLILGVFPPTFILSHYIERLRWATDSQLICRSVSYINRYIPLLNFGTWNQKRHFVNYNRDNSIFQYGYENDNSMSSMFDLFSPYFYDSGCAILSNTPPTQKEFLPFDPAVKNRGVLWCYYDKFKVLVMTISTEKTTYEEIEFLMSLQNILSNRFHCKTTYIMGDFKHEIIFDERIMSMIPMQQFKIQNVENLSPTTYLIHNYVFDVNQVGKIFKPRNIVVTSPPYFNIIRKTVELTEKVMEEEEEVVVVEKEHTQKPISPSTVTEINSSEEEGDESKSQSVFPYIIFNYFSTQKTTPPSASPPNQSPKSEDGWSKV